VKVLLYPARPWTGRNPYLDLLYEQFPLDVRVEDFSYSRALRCRYQIVHVHWPERVLSALPRARSIVRAVALLAVLVWLRMRGTKLVWTVHNLEHHELGGTIPADVFWRLFTPLVTAVISLTEVGRTAIRENFPRLRNPALAVVPIGTYRDVYPSPPDRAAARAALGIPVDATVVAFVGLIRPYKNVPGLIEAFRQFPDDDVVLLVGGKPLKEAWGREVEAAAGGDPRVRLHLDFLPPEHLLRHLAAADLVVLPFLEMFNSSSALLALSFDRPILVPDTSTMRELRDLVGASWVRCYEGHLDGTVLLETARKVQSEERSEHAPLEDFAWDRLAADTVAFYRQVLGMASVLGAT